MAQKDARRRPGQGSASLASTLTTTIQAGPARTADLRALAAAMPEDRAPDSLEAHVRKMLADLGLFGYHTRNSQRSVKGWPDWVIVGRRVIYRELKSEVGRVTPEQQQVGSLLTRAGQNWRVWRPSDLLSGQIARELTEVAGLQESLFSPGGTT